MERKDKSEKPPALYDLTTLQREANRLLGYTAQQTLDYLQNLYEKKLCTYPRTDSRYLTSDMVEGLPVLVNAVEQVMPCTAGIAVRVNAAPVINDKKVSDHHAVIPTQNIRDADMESLPIGEKAILQMVALRLFCAVAQPYEYAETTVTLDCSGHTFSAKGRAVQTPGWKALEQRYRTSLKDMSKTELWDRQCMVFMFRRIPGRMECICCIFFVGRQYFPMTQLCSSMILLIGSLQGIPSRSRPDTIRLGCKQMGSRSIT